MVSRAVAPSRAAPVQLGRGRVGVGLGVGLGLGLVLGLGLLLDQGLGLASRVAAEHQHSTHGNPLS